jgi:L-aspartate oxidase
MAELAPRDIVARAIFWQHDRGLGAYLDARSIMNFSDRYPTVNAHAHSVGLDPSQDLLPVSPAAHYYMGGIDTDINGRASVPGLWAVGECSSSGVHGANRLASNSLLEGLVFGRRAALSASDDLANGSGSPPPLPGWNPGAALAPEEGVVVTHNWDEVRRLMWNYVGIVRTMKRLERARTRLKNLRDEIRDYYWQYRLTSDLVELRNLADVAMLIVECARQRKESRGLHYMLDFPNTDERWLRDTVLTRGDLD